MTRRRPNRETPTTEPQHALVPMPSFDHPDATKRGGGSLGMTIERARKRLGLSVEAACRDLMLTERELNQYESGLRTPSQGVLERLAELYGLDVERLKPGTQSGLERGGSPDKADRLWIGWTPVEIDRLETGNGPRLRAVAQAIRFMRGASDNDSFVVRDDEVDLFAEVLDVYAPDLVDDIAKWFALDQTEAETLASRIRRSSNARPQLSIKLEAD